MNRTIWLGIVTPLFVVWGLDRITKLWAMSLEGIYSLGPISCVLHHNHGAMLGLFSTTPPVIRVVSLATGGAFLLFFFLVIQYLLPIKSLLLRSGISVLLGGILGNVADRTIYGYVIDFIVIRAPIVSSAAFNLADALQWVGYAMISTSLIRESEVLWPTENTRKSLWVNPRFQLRYCFILMAVGVGFATIAGVFSYTFLRITIIEFAGAHPKILDNYLQPFLLAFIAVTLTFLAILFVVGRSLSARIAGPFYAFELFLDDLMTRKARPLRLRSGDEFRNLEQIADRIMTEMTRLSREAEAAKTEQKRDPYPDSDD